MYADAALLEVWPVDDGAEEWTVEALERVEWLLPVLVEAGYVRTGEVGSPPTAVWCFTERGVDRWCEIRRERRRDAFRRFRRLRRLEERLAAGVFELAADVSELAAAEYLSQMRAHSLVYAKELHDRARPEAGDWTMRVPRRWRKWQPPP